MHVTQGEGQRTCFSGQLKEIVLLQYCRDGLGSNVVFVLVSVFVSVFVFVFVFVSVFQGVGMDLYLHLLLHWLEATTLGPAGSTSGSYGKPAALLDNCDRHVLANLGLEPSSFLFYTHFSICSVV